MPTSHSFDFVCSQTDAEQGQAALSNIVFEGGTWLLDIFGIKQRELRVDTGRAGPFDRGSGPFF